MKPEIDDLISTRWTLIERLKNWDDEESWRAFFETYWKLIYGVARKSGLTHAEAQDVVQETVVSLCKSMKNFKADPAFGSFKSWLLNLTRWRITDQVRKRGQEVQAPADAGMDSRTTAPEDRIVDARGNALEKIWAEEWQQHVVEAALERVKKQADARHYQVFYLAAIKELPADKVAHAMSIKVDQVYLLKHRLGKLFVEAVQDIETYTGRH